MSSHLEQLTPRLATGIVLNEETQLDTIDFLLDLPTEERDFK